MDFVKAYIADTKFRVSQYSTTYNIGKYLSPESVATNNLIKKLFNNSNQNTLEQVKHNKELY